jgi:hypothetical protein
MIIARKIDEAISKADLTDGQIHGSQSATLCCIDNLGLSLEQPDVLRSCFSHGSARVEFWLQGQGTEVSFCEVEGQSQVHG